jgi:hypothetical protein
VAHKQSLKDALVQEKQDDTKKVMQSVEEYAKQEEEKKLARLAKNKNHLNEMQKLQQPGGSRPFAKTGVAIVP